MANDIPPVPYNTPMMDSSGLISRVWSAWFRQLFKRVGGNTTTIMTNPMTGEGDAIYGGSSGTPTRLAGSTSSTKKFLTQTGTGSVSAAPGWNTIAATDLPTVALTGDVTGSASGGSIATAYANKVPLAKGGTNADLSATGGAGKYLKQSTAGGNVSVAAISASDVPTLNQNTTGTAANVTGTVAVANGGTGAVTKSAAFDALSPMTTSGDIIYGGASGTGTRLAKGSDGNYLKLVSGVPSWAAVTATSTAPTVQKFTSGSAATYTTPTNPVPLYIRVRMMGGGGGGGGSGTGTSGGAGGDGGESSFGTTLLTANGGKGAASGNSATAGAGGTASLGTGPVGLAITGSYGANGQNSSSGTGGVGGNSPLGGAGGGGGPGGNSGAAGIAAIANTGSGGGGGGSGGSTANGAAGGGGSGGYVDAIITSPGSSYTYTVGSAGSAGSAGTSGSAGGAGAAGIIIVEEFYQ